MRSHVEPERTAGLCYAATEAGVRLPVVDITHAAFASDYDEHELDRIAAKTRLGLERMRKLPVFALRLLTTRSVIARDMRRAPGGVVSGMTTYLFKLGPQHLPAGFGSRLDRRMLAGLGPVACRLRLRETAGRLARALVPALAQRRGPLTLINVAGGPAADSFNALILLLAHHPELVAGRPAEIIVLDIDREGPAFGARAVTSLRQESGPLSALDVRFSHLQSDWADAGALSRALSGLDPQAVAAASSEGGLFEYADDDVVRASLAVLRDRTPEDMVFVGSLVRDEGFQWLTAGDGAPSLRPRGLRAFGALVASVGWTVESTTTLALYHVVTLKKAG
jgi:hypothetical protein